VRLLRVVDLWYRLRDVATTDDGAATITITIDGHALEPVILKRGARLVIRNTNPRSPRLAAMRGAGWSRPSVGT
jgi:hypothetical protein